MSQATDHITVCYRLAIAARVFAAAIGGYILTSLFTIVLAMLWPLPQAQALAASTMLSFLVYAIVIMWAFSVSRLRTVWIGIVTAIVVLAVLAWVLVPEIRL